MSELIILVPLDGSLRALAALPVAKTLGEITGASLRVIHVSARTPPPLAELVERLGIVGVALPGSSIEARVGEPSAQILAEARTMGACLIVMCTHSAAARPQTVLGHTALEVLRTTSCPVLLVSPAQHGLEHWRPNRIVLPYDGSPTANAAIGPAAELARRAGSEIHVLQVGVPGVSAPIERGSLTMPLYVDQPQHEWSSWTGELLERLATQCPGHELHAHLHLRGGEPAPEIVRLATDQAADLIVLAWKGEWADEHATTLKAVIRDAPCPVMIVRA